MNKLRLLIIGFSLFVAIQVQEGIAMASSITYNAWESTRKMSFYDASEETFTSRNGTTGDYFTDDCTVGDCLYISQSQTEARNFKNIKFYIGTAFAATSVTFVWEYASGSSSWTALPDLVDNTSDFSLTDERTVTWTVPNDWRFLGSPRPSLNYPFWVRCRITAIDTPTEGGAQSTQIIQVGNNAIEVSGYTSGTPCTFKDIYDEDVAQSWGVVTNVGDFYKIDCNLQTALDGTASYIGDTNIGVEVNGLLYLYNNGHIKFGTHEGDYKTRYGCFYVGSFSASFMRHIKGTRVGTSFEAYSTNFIFPNISVLVDVGCVDTTIINCEFSHFTEFIVSAATNLIMYNVYLSDGTYIRGAIPDGSIVEKVTMYTGYVAYSIGSVGFDIILRGLVTLPDTNLMRVWSSNIYRFVDCTLNNRIVSWAGSGVGHEIYLEYTLNLTVVDATGEPIVGATVTVVDVNGDAVTGSPFTTNGDGKIDAGDLLQYLLTNVGGAGGTTVETLFTPHTVVISKTGYSTRTIKYTMDRKREEIEKLTGDGTNLYDMTLYGATIY